MAVYACLNSFLELQEFDRVGWSHEKTNAVGSRCTRSGFIVPVSIWDGPAFEISPLLIDLIKTVDFDDAVRAERI
jgi:hypothetical protein